MITNSESNVKFTDEQDYQLKEWQRRLYVIQEEIKKAETTMEGLRGNLEASIKHDAYLNELLFNLERQVKELTDRKSLLENEVETNVHKLAELRQASEERLNVLHEKEVEHIQRENKVKESHDELLKHKEIHNSNVKRLSEQQLLVEKAQKAFLEATKYVTWG